MLFSFFNTKIKQYTFLCILISFFSIKSSAQDQENEVQISGQLRTRFELRDGAFRPLATNEKPAALISERIRLKLDYNYSDLISVRISPQTVSIWGQANMVQGSENSGNRFALYEAWTKLNVNPEFNIKLGRQVISLDDERIFGELDWAQGGRVHDAISLHFNMNKYEVKGFVSYNQNYKTLYGNNLSNPTGNLYSNTDAFPYKLMQTVWASIPLGKYSKLTFLGTNLGFQQAQTTTKDTVTIYAQTAGANFFHNSKKVTANASLYYQYSNNPKGLQTNAYLVAAYAAYHFDKKWDLGIGSDFVSGNDVGTSISENNSFNPYFHTGHKFYGYMDYYYSGNTHKNAGLSDTYLKLNYKSKDGHGFSAAFHQFYTPNQVIDTSKKVYNGDLGQELDLSFSYKINKFATLMGGYSFYLNTPTLNYLKSVPLGKEYQQWAWLSLNVNPTFIKSKF
ncbi:MAG: hypothetical protein UZ11_BCD004000337 [Bacteroidetes bacterium OLB11]|nr:MAG: hypothetical protein UZ11_BCD004000337 [Bacteroidetes bacterium OLB11]